MAAIGIEGARAGAGVLRGLPEKGARAVALPVPVHLRAVRAHFFRVCARADGRASGGDPVPDRCVHNS
jgi:hypothetical protein